MEDREIRLVIRAQMIFAIRRKNEYWTGGSWHPDIRLAKLFPEKQCKRAIRIDIGMSGCEVVEIMPVENIK